MNDAEVVITLGQKNTENYLERFAGRFRNGTPEYTHSEKRGFFIKCFVDKNGIL